MTDIANSKWILSKWDFDTNQMVEKEVTITSIYDGRDGTDWVSYEGEGFEGGMGIDNFLSQARAA